MQLQFDRVVFFGRSWPESMAMYALDEPDLQGRRILDCPGGLVAGALDRGIDMTAVDPQDDRTPMHASAERVAHGASAFKRRAFLASADAISRRQKPSCPAGSRDRQKSALP